MIAASIIALRKSVRIVLINDTALIASLGGPHFYDEIPAHVTLPYAGFGDVRSRDWSTATDQGVEHTLAIDVWSDHHGAQEALAIAEIIAGALELAPLSMTSHRLISLRAQSVETRRENGGRVLRARQIFHVTTEQA